MSVRDVIIVGAGPSGLAAAIAAKQHHLDYRILDKGVLVDSIYRFPPQMVFFTTPELMEIGGLPFVSPYDKPTRLEALRYYRKVVDTYELDVTLEECVLSVSRDDQVAAAEGLPRVFAVESRSSRPEGGRRVRHARNVVFAIGYYDHANMMNVPGEDLPHVHHYQAEPHGYYRRRVVVVGGGNSAAEAALELYRAGAHVTLVHRWPELKSTIKYWVRPDIDNRVREGVITGLFNTTVTSITPTSVIVSEGVPDNGGPVKREIPADAVFLLTGYRADSELMTAAGIELTDRDAPVYDPLTFETNVPGLFVAGGALAGADTGTVFIENGRFHGQRIIEEIAGREGAR
jgi:thioredoxin reductase (NADPH)